MVLFVIVRAHGQHHTHTSLQYILYLRTVCVCSRWRVQSNSRLSLSLSRSLRSPPTTDHHRPTPFLRPPAHHTTTHTCTYSMILFPPADTRETVDASPIVSDSLGCTSHLDPVESLVVDRPSRSTNLLFRISRPFAFYEPTAHVTVADRILGPKHHRHCFRVASRKAMSPASRATF
jgi:hypothetical protein